MDFFCFYCKIANETQDTISNHFPKKTGRKILVIGVQQDTAWLVQNK